MPIATVVDPGRIAGREGLGASLDEGSLHAPGMPVRDHDRNGFGPAEHAVLDAVLDCVGRFGVAKTTLDDVAQRAGISRATVYRLFPGGKSVVLLAAADRERDRLLEQVQSDLESVVGWRDTLVVTIHSSYCALRRHPTLTGLMAVEPTAIAPYLAFDRIEPVVAFANRHLGSRLAVDLGDRRARQVSSWAVRVLLSYLVHPDHEPGTLDLADRAHVAALVDTYLVPGLRATLARVADTT